MYPMEEHVIEKATFAFRQLIDIVVRLRAPDGCAWDREQTVESLRGALIEETYECIDAIDNLDIENLREELGDLFLLVTMMSYISEQTAQFSLPSVLEEISAKLIRRHPHVFGDSAADTPEKIVEQWNEIKKTEKTGDLERRKSAFDGVSRALPPLKSAYEYQLKAARVGFDWPSTDQVYGKIYEEINEVKTAIENSEVGSVEVEGEIGDLLFTVVNLSRRVGVEPDVALLRTISKFKSRFTKVENRMSSVGRKMDASELDLMDQYWEESKER